MRATQAQSAAHPQFRAPFSRERNDQQKHCGSHQQAGEERWQPGKLLANRRKKHDLVDFQCERFLHHVRLEGVNSEHLEGRLTKGMTWGVVTGVNIVLANHDAWHSVRSL